MAAVKSLLVCFSFISLLCDASYSLDGGQRKIFLVLTDRSYTHGRSSQEVEAFHDKILEQNLHTSSYTKLYSYVAINGFAIHTTYEKAAKLSKCDGIVGVARDRGSEILTIDTPRFLGLSTQGGLWEADRGIENAGENMVIGLVDWGINPLHPSFQNANNTYPPLPNFKSVCDVGPLFPRTSCNGKILTARYFAKGHINSMGLSDEGFSPYDDYGHGSHTASTAAGNSRVDVKVNSFTYGKASGMAPRARLAIYRALFGDENTEADVIAAIDQAIQDRVDVLSLSLTIPHLAETRVLFNVFDIALFHARSVGIIVVQGAGNSGPLPSTTVSLSPWILSVGSTDTSRRYYSNLVLGDGSSILGLGISGPTKGRFATMVWSKDARISREQDGLLECQKHSAFNRSVVQGKLIICIVNVMKVDLYGIQETARTLGATGLILAATHDAYQSLIDEPVIFSFPTIIIPTPQSSRTLKHYYLRETRRTSDGNVISYGATGKIMEGRHAHFDREAPVVSRFSSRGPAVSKNENFTMDLLKPDIVGPGGEIWAAWSSTSFTGGQDFAIASGTSMSTPHVAGIAALIKQMRKHWTPDMINSAIGTTASMVDNRGHNLRAHAWKGKLALATPLDCGAGFINATSALNPGLVFPIVIKDYVKFLCSLPKVTTDEVRRATGHTCQKKYKHLSDLNLPSITIASLNGFRTVRRIVRNVEDQEESYTVFVENLATALKIDVSPSKFKLKAGHTAHIKVTLRSVRPTNSYAFANVVMRGHNSHVVKLPVSAFLS